MLKLVLSAGHGKNTEGKRCSKHVDKNETREWVLNNKVATLVENKLLKYKDVSVTRVDDVTGKEDVSLSRRVSETNQRGADLLLCIHHNASGSKTASKTASGVTVYRYTNSKMTSEKELKKFYQSIVNANGLKGNRRTPLGEANWTELAKTNCEAMYLENGFMDSYIDTPIIITGKHSEATARGIVDYLVERYNLKLKETFLPTPSEETGKQVGAYTVFTNATTKAEEVLRENGRVVITFDNQYYRVFK